MEPSIPLGMALATKAAQVVLLASQVQLYFFARRFFERKGTQSARPLAVAVAAAGTFFMLLCNMFPLAEALGWRNRLELPVWAVAADVWAAGWFGASVLWWIGCAWQRVFRRSGDSLAGAPEQPARRQLLETAAKAAVAAPFAVAGYGVFIGRKSFELREVDMPCPDLPADLEGLRLVQVTDIHAGPYLSAKDLSYVVDMANETKPHVALVTGDLITEEGDPLDSCLEVLGGLRADAGIFGCLGNHERFAEAEVYTCSYGRKKGLRFLRDEAEKLRFGDASLNLAGVDYQRKNEPYLVGAGQMLDSQSTNVLLSHNPDVFPKASELGYDLVVSGHTHGGQVTLEIVEQTLNPGHFFTPYVVGRYKIGQSHLYVSRGVGTVNLPMRIGALPEVALLRLRRA